MSALLKVENYASVSQQKVFWNNQTFLSLSRSVTLVMAIMTILAMVTILAIETDIHGYCGHIGLETNMAIVTVPVSKPT